MITRVYKDADITIRVKGYERGDSVRLHVEHKGGAALIVPNCDRTPSDAGARFQTRGFDGIEYTLDIDEAAGTLRIVASGDAEIMGDRRERLLQRVPDVEPRPPAIRISGDEVTRPLSVLKPKE